MKEAAKPTESYYSPQEYLAFERASEIKHEYVSGLILAMSGASRAHNRIAGNVFRELDNKLRVKGECEPFISDMRVRTTPSDYTYPDVVVVGEAEFEDAEVDTLLNPTVIVEVLSKSTEKRDRVEKFADYRGIPSLKEYILISQDRLHVEHYVRGANLEWTLTDMNKPGGKVVIASLGCELFLKDVYERVEFPKPPHLRQVSASEERDEEKSS
ncbi:MAG: Uma2 family endonuclease [Pyrinomonadaceae bacterium]|nr:Uma2 family endonuclease [Pyrinomonadaceae bacterium]